MPTPAISRPDPGALSGLLAGVGFVGGLAGAMALADLPFPRPGADPAQIRKYFTQDAGRPWSSQAVTVCVCFGSHP